MAVSFLVSWHLSVISNSTAKFSFHASRLPVKPSDTARKYDPDTYNHVVFVRKNKFFKVPLSHNGKELTAAELEVQIERVIQLAGNDLAEPVGALTSDNRDVWADARAELIAASPSNIASLEAIESSMIVVALDDTKPVTRQQACWNLWVGDGRNRFFDKHQRTWITPLHMHSSLLPLTKIFMLS